MDIDWRRRLANLLDLRGWSHGKLACRTKISRSNISTFLSNSDRDIGFSKAIAIAKALDISLDWLAGLPKRNPNKLEPDEDELVNLYRLLPDYEKPAILGSVRLHVRVMGEGRGDDGQAHASNT